ncbi:MULTISPECIES: DUF2752 domain-containing protein [Thermomonosporaceae]|uniref:DUF2752 domain-containing protein n=1 Tax=Thermomonosporaceae TaxID=2012 RepID=UPI00255B2597|nr:MULTISPECIES: DUF2752 domain-containing protein [Thermomonosporaceae]MDL4773333.1 DUF2752 domain-containing protein [Actinomadura xylanilytica]
MGGAPGAAVTGAPKGALGGLTSRTLTAARHGPTGTLLRVAAMAIAAVGAAWIHRANDPGVLCPLRAITQIPCPLCGGTTVFIELGSGRPAQAVLANPVALTGAIGVAVAPLGVAGRWWALQPRTRAWVLGTALVGSELWQLARLGLPWV